MAIGSGLQRVNSSRFAPTGSESVPGFQARALIERPARDRSELPSGPVGYFKSNRPEAAYQLRVTLNNTVRGGPASPSLAKVVLLSRTAIEYCLSARFLAISLASHFASSEV